MTDAEAQGYYAKGNELFQSGQYEQALECFTQVRQASVEVESLVIRVGSLLCIGSVLCILRRFGEAVEVYRQATVLAPLCADAHSRLGRCYVQRGAMGRRSRH